MSKVIRVEESNPIINFLASEEDLRKIDLKSLFNEQTIKNESEAYAKFQSLVKIHAGDELRNSYRLLASLMSFHMSIDNNQISFTPIFQDQNGRTHIPNDFIGKQNEVLSTILNDISNDIVRARIADVVWQNDRSNIESSKIAVESYCRIIHELISIANNREKNETGHDNNNRVVLYLMRIIQIIRMTNKKNFFPDEIIDTFKQVYVYAENIISIFTEIASIALKHSLYPVDEIAKACERLAIKEETNTYPMALKRVLDFAVLCYEKNNDKVSSSRCRELSVLQTLKMADSLGQASARAHWIRKAIGELRRFSSDKEKIKQLRLRLLDEQDQSIDEMGTFSTSIDLTELVKLTNEEYEYLSVSEILFNFAYSIRLISVKDLRDEVLENRGKYLFSSLMTSTYMDNEGKVTGRGVADSLSGEASDEWIKEQSVRNLDMHRQVNVNGTIEPIRIIMFSKAYLEEHHFYPITYNSPFVPQGFERIFSLGFAKFWQGDYISAVHLLVPMLENSIRYVLSNVLIDSSKMDNQLLQEDRSLSGLLENMRSELETVFGVTLTNEIDMLFNYKIGPSLRHEMAHGKASTGFCFNHNAIYACWLIYMLTCLPLKSHWENVVKPDIDVFF